MASNTLKLNNASKPQKEQNSSSASSAPPSLAAMMRTSASAPALIGPTTPPSDFVPITPEIAMHGRNSLIASSAIRQVRRVSKQAALNTKKQIWDSNDASIVAAQSAVDQWEQGYNALRGLLFAIGDSAQGLYGAAKTGASGLEHGFLLPVRDWILLPAFGGMEKIAGETIGFLQSDDARNLAHHSLGLARQVPFVGENILAPALCIGADALKKTWDVVQYPIPSPNQVRDSVDFVMTGTKWALSSAGREISLYAKRADANITRTLSHTQWKVLGSGPYATLDKLSKREVIDHLCERYFSLTDSVGRYELAAHVRAHNRPLYHDLVLTGLLRKRGGDLTSDDEWLSSWPKYRDLEGPFLLDDQVESGEVFSLWFRLPNQNGKRPKRDAPWTQFCPQERNKLERFYRWVLKNNKNNTATLSSGREAFDGQTTADKTPTSPSKYASNAKWYNPDPKNDLLLDQKRHAVSFFPCCPKCRRRHAPVDAPLVPKKYGELCQKCVESHGKSPWVDTLLSPPSLAMLYRPTMWRFYGPGDEIRRATWFLDTTRNGLQPYGEEAQAVLEDAYLFLKWTARSRVWDGSILLTVQVPSPDGEDQLVQFSSLTSATAIGKGLGSAIAIFKRRVYRGAYNGRNPIEDPDRDTGALGGDEVSDSEVSEESESYGDLKERIGDLSMIEERSIDTEFSDVKHNLEIEVDDESTSDEINDEVKQRILSDGDEEDWLKLQHDQSQQLHPRKHGPNAVHDMKSISTDDGGAEEKVFPREERNEMNIYTDEIKSLRIRLSQPLDEHLLLAYDMKQVGGETENIDDGMVENDGSDDVDHLVLIVHGIGEMLQSIDFSGLSKLPTIVDCCGFLRKNHSEVLEVRFSQLYKQLDGIRHHRRGPGRVEYLPVEWHEKFTIQSQRNRSGPSLPVGPSGRNYSINDISLRTIPQLRQFANDSLMDVLFFMSPEHHDIIVDIVVNEMNHVVERFRAMTGFQGNVSVVGHSLGSIIAWDILDNQKGFREALRKFQSTGPARVPSAKADDTDATEDEHRTENAETSSINHDGDISESAANEIGGQADEATDVPAGIPDYPQLNFTVDSAFMLGSPIAVFLMIRNQRQPLSLDFTLSGCSQVFNIFHPYDPVAYRIEPLLNPRNAEVEPKIMTHWHGGFRFQYQTKLLWKKIVEETVKTQENVVASLESGIAALGLLDGNASDDEEDVEFEGNLMPHSVVTGHLNRGHRIDYMLQEKELESANEYVAALAAHSCYWLEKDLSLFIARQICVRAWERNGDARDSLLRTSS